MRRTSHLGQTMGLLNDISIMLRSVALAAGRFANSALTHRPRPLVRIHDSES
jgi:hypothetical protein